MATPAKGDRRRRFREEAPAPVKAPKTPAKPRPRKGAASNKRK